MNPPAPNGSPGKPVLLTARTYNQRYDSPVTVRRMRFTIWRLGQ